MSLYYEVAFNLPIDGVFTYTLPEGESSRIGCRVTAPFGRRLLKGYIVSERSTPPEGVTEIKSIKKIIDVQPLFSEQLLSLAQWISRTYICSLGEALGSMLPGGKRESIPDDVLLPDVSEIHTGYALAGQQLDAIEAISSYLHMHADTGTFYLYGVTGSGKTDVYLETAKRIMDAGRDVIFLVPEISLTHQIVEICRKRFGSIVAVLHSGFTPSQRLAEWRRIAGGQARIVIGARSGVFAPVKNLGLVVIDEEHEGAYKSSQTPRYHARQVAAYRCMKENALLLMGSATPSLEAYHQIRTGKLASFYMPHRLSGGKMPAVEIVDMKDEKHIFSRRLTDEIVSTSHNHKQTILFLNRRGFSYYFHCKSCSYEMKCRHCSVSLTFHKKKWKMICHYCGYSEEPVMLCPECGSVDVGYSGFGTEKIEEDVQSLFPGLKISRIDTDTIRQKGKLKSIFDDFRNGKIDILLGTQMVAKGLNFPLVRLVGIVSADTSLNLPDFRAEERTFHLIVQVSGRAGRANPDGRVIVQTLKPGNNAIRCAALMRHEEFYEKELAVRQEQGFPPFSRLIRLVFRSRNEETAFNTALDFFDAMKPHIQDIADILGPAECPISIIAGNHRFQLIFRAPGLTQLHRHLRAVLRQFRCPAKVYVEIDVDPVSLL